MIIIVCIMCHCLISWFVWCTPQWHFTVTECELRTYFFLSFCFLSLNLKRREIITFFKSSVTWWGNETRFSLLAWLESYQTEEVMLFHFSKAEYSPSREAETFKAECSSTWTVVKADICADARFHVQVAAGKPQDANDFENILAKHSEVASKRYARLNTDLRV